MICGTLGTILTLQSEWPQTIMCLIPLTTQLSSRAAGSLVVGSSRKCCECGIKLPALRTKIDYKFVLVKIAVIMKRRFKL